MSAKHVTYKSYTSGPCFQIFNEPIPSIIRTAQPKRNASMDSKRREGSQAQVRPCTGQEQNPCTSWVWQEWQTSGGWVFPSGRANYRTYRTLSLAGARTWVLPSVANLAAKCCILSHLMGISVLVLVFLACFPSLTLAASSSFWELRRLPSV